MHKIKTFLELIRLPGLFTAHADIFAGFLIAGAGLHMAGRLFILIAASSCLFSAGMVFNDYFDYDIDAEQRPDRPIPSGRISRFSALCAGIILTGLGIIFLTFAGHVSFLIGLTLAAAILLYDGVLKQNAFAGPLCMALCRYLNLLLGLSILSFNGWIFIPLVTGIYIFGVTVLSRVETYGKKAVFHIIICCMCVGMVPLILFYLYIIHMVPNITGPILSILFAMAAAARILKLLDHHTPFDYQNTIRFLLLSIILLETIIASGFVSMIHASLILVLYLPALYSVRLFKVT